MSSPPPGWHHCCVDLAPPSLHPFIPFPSFSHPSIPPSLHSPPPGWYHYFIDTTRLNGPCSDDGDICLPDFVRPAPPLRGGPHSAPAPPRPAPHASAARRPARRSAAPPRRPARRLALLPPSLGAARRRPDPGGAAQPQFAVYRDYLVLTIDEFAYDPAGSYYGRAPTAPAAAHERTNTRTLTHAHARTHTHTHARTRTHAQTLAHNCTLKRARTHTVPSSIARA
jgi:hypothetical protein